MTTHGFNKRGVNRIVRAVRKSEGPPAQGGRSSERVPDAMASVFVIKSYEDADSPAKNRWKYTLTEVRKTETGPDGWTEVADGDGLFEVDGYNLAETINVAYTGATTSPTILGNGIDVGRTPAQDFDIAPAPEGRIVRGWVYLIDGDNGTQSVEVWFEFNNMLDGECP